MPYTASNLPDDVKKLPAHAQSIWREAYNAAFKQYDGNEETANKVAWAAVKKQYRKDGDEWVRLETLVMKPADWKKAYRKGTPHWAKDTEPTAFAADFVDVLTGVEAKSVLEVGCGNGRDSILFAKAGIKATAVDIAPEAVEMGKAAAEKAEAEVDFRVADGTKLPFDDETFDAFYSLSVLHSTDITKSIPEAFRVLASGGVAFIYLYGNTMTKDGDTKDVIELDDYLALLHDTGFAVDDFYCEEEDDYDDYGEKHRLFVALLSKK